MKIIKWFHKTKYHFYLDISVCLMEMFAWLGIFLAVQIKLENADSFDYWLGLGIPVVYVVVYLLREKVKNLWWLLSGHALLYMVVFFLLLPSPQIQKEVSTFLLALITGCLIGSIDYYRFDRSFLEYRIKWYFILEVLFLFFWGLFTKNESIKWIGVFLGVIFLVFHMWCTYLDSLNIYLDEKESMNNVPVREIFKNSFSVVSVLLFCLTIALLFLVTINQNGFLDLLKKYIMLGIKKILWLIGLVVQFFANFSVMGDTMGGDEVKDELIMSPPANTVDVHIWWMEIGGLIIISVLLLFGLREFYLWIKKRTKKKITIRKSLLIPDEIEAVDEQEEGTLGKLLKKVFRSNQEKVRYLFKSRVKKGLGQKIRESKTSEELRDDVLKQGQIDIGNLTELYQIARYSQREITREQIREVKKNSIKVTEEDEVENQRTRG